MDEMDPQVFRVTIPLTFTVNDWTRLVSCIEEGAKQKGPDWQKWAENFGSTIFSQIASIRVAHYEAKQQQNEIEISEYEKERRFDEETGNWLMDLSEGGNPDFY